jgi:hypothetical protein
MRSGSQKKKKPFCITHFFSTGQSGEEFSHCRFPSCKLSSVDEGFLASHAAIRELDLSKNRLSNANFLLDHNGSPHCPALQTLDLSDNDLETVAPLTKLKSLLSLRIAGNARLPV